jgi:hypothetical protein
MWIKKININSCLNNIKISRNTNVGHNDIPKCTLNNHLQLLMFIIHWVHNTLISNIIHENILTTLENPSPHHDKYFQKLLETPIHPCVCCHQLCFTKKTRKLSKSMIQKYFLHVPSQKQNPLLCKTCYSFFNKNKAPKL